MTPVVAIASEFLDAFARIPRAQQRKVREFTEKFRESPTSSAINYEKIHGTRDDKIRTVRIGLDYRAVVLHPDTGNIYMLVWVDHHDEAMAWARDRVFEVNPATGSLQIVNVTAAEDVDPAAVQAGLFAAVDDADLLALGVPQVLLPAVRAVGTRDELTALRRHLPAEASEALMWLAEGIPVDEVLVATESTKKAQRVDTQDFAKALEHPDSKRRFVKVNSQHDISSILNAPLEKWRVFLHPSQERVVARSFKGSAKVTGGAGTGKTVVAMHRARHLVRHVFPEKTDRVLVTTFTRNLARDIDQNLRNLCGEEYKRLEVVHLHHWAVRFMKTQDIQFDIASDQDTHECWEQAINVTGETHWSEPFLRDEWEQIILPNGIETKRDYLAARRIGRGKALSRVDRARIWAVVDEYRRGLQARGKVEWTQVIRQTRQYLEKEEHKSLLPYRAVVVDEGQDFHEEELKLIRALVPEGSNDIFIAGDAHQRIYGRAVVLGRCGISVRGRSTRLRINYRTTEEIKNWSLSILHGVQVDDLDGGVDDQVGYVSLLSGPPPAILKCPTLGDELETLVRLVRELLQQRKPHDICVVARTTKMLRRDYAPALDAAGIESTVLEQDEVNNDGGVRLATMHRVKGLEFPCMILAGVNKGVLPYVRKSLEDDPAAQQEHDVRERSLLFVAATRARDWLAITCSGEASPYLNDILV